MKLRKISFILIVSLMILLITGCRNRTSDILIDTVAESTEIEKQYNIQNIENDTIINDFVNDLERIDIDSIEYEDMSVYWYNYEYNRCRLNIYMDSSFSEGDINLTLLKDPMKEIHEKIIKSTSCVDCTIEFSHRDFQVFYNESTFTIATTYHSVGAFEDGVDNFESKMINYFMNEDVTGNYMKIEFSNLHLVLRKNEDSVVTVHTSQCMGSLLCTEEGYQEILLILEEYLPTLTFVESELP